MYDILLVDDEEDARHAIVEKLDWESLGFKVAGEAGNGLEALEMLDTLVPDVIIADIRMPFMDGLELCREARKLIADVKLVIFSGFNEFEYAREAISTGVIEYIMKPIDAEDLSIVFRRLKEQLDRELRHRREFDRFRRRYESHILFLRQQYLALLLMGAKVEKEKWQEIDLDFTAEKYGVVSIKYDLGEENKVFTEEEQHLLPLSLTELITDMLGKDIKFHPVMFPDHVSLIILMSAGKTMKGMVPVFQRIILPAQKMFEADVPIGLGNSVKDLSEISRSYADSLDALEYSSSSDNGQIIYKGDIALGKKEKLVEEGKTYIDEHYHDTQLSLENIANALSVTQPYFSFIFKKIMKKSPVSYLTEVRLKAATELLLKSNVKTNQIAEMVGYMDTNYFRYVFKKNIGMSPISYRAAHRKDDADDVN